MHTRSGPRTILVALLRPEPADMNENPRSPERERLLAAAAELAPMLREAAPEAEAQRHLPRRCVDAMLDADLFRCAAPREVGGLEVDPVTTTEVFAAVAAADGAAGWNLMIGATWAGWLGARLPDEGAAAVFDGSAWPLIAGHVAPLGRAAPAEGGYSVSGHWKFASGIHHASWIASACDTADAPAAGPGGVPNLVAVVPRSSVDVVDNWQVAGLRGTGSCDYHLSDVAVSSGFSFSMMTPARRGSPWWQMPAIVQAGPAHTGFALGVARRCLDEVAALGEKRRTRATVAEAQRESVQLALGRLTVEYRAARAYCFETFAQADERAARGQPVRQLRPTAVYATEVAVRCAEFAYRTLGAAALFESHPVQRYLRDILAAQQHVAASDAGYVAYGAAALGAGPPTPGRATPAPQTD